MWIAWNEHDGQPTGDSFVLFVEARCASKKFKPMLPINESCTDSSGHKLRDLSVLGALGVKISFDEANLNVSDETEK